MTQVKEPETKALKRLKNILQATMFDCSEVLSQERLANRATGAPTRSYYQGKMDGLASVLGLLEQLDPLSFKEEKK